MGVLVEAGAAAEMQRVEDDELVLELNAVAPHPLHKAPTHFFRILHRVFGNELGHINLRNGSGEHINLYAGHVGFTVYPGYRGHGYAWRALRLLVQPARELRIDPLWITCDPENIASRRTCERAGAQLVEIRVVPRSCIIYQSGHPRKCRYRLNVSGEL